MHQLKVFNMNILTKQKTSWNAVAPDAAEEIPEEAERMGPQFSLTAKHSNSDHPEQISKHTLA